jgi:hypothetical protein
MPKRHLKKLRRQSLLEDEAFDFAEIALRVAAETGAQDATMTAVVEAGAEVAPLCFVGARQVVRIGRLQAGCGGGEEAHGTAEDGGGRRGFSSRGAPVVIAMRSKELLQIIIRARQARNGVAVEQPRAIAPRHLGEVRDGVGQLPRLAAMTAHRADQPMQAPAHGTGGEAGLVLENARRLMNPGEGDLHIRP